MEEVATIRTSIFSARLLFVASTSTRSRRRRRRLRGPRGRRFDATLNGLSLHRWIPVTKLGRLVKEGRIRSLEEIFLHSMPIKEHQIVDHFFPPVR